MEPSVPTLALDPAELVLEIGDSARVVAAVRDARGRALDRAVSWSASDTSVIRVSSSGSVRGLAQGLAWVKAAVEGRSDSVRVRVNGPAPVLFAVTPDFLEVGSADLTLRLTGNRFTRSSKVLWNGQERPTTYFDSTKLQVMIPAADLGVATVANVTVFTPSPGGGTSPVQSITVAEPVKPVRMLLSAGEKLTCAIATDGRAYCWGQNNGGEFGNGELLGTSAKPVAVAGGHSFIHISTPVGLVGRNQMGACALTREGAAYCWGDSNWKGQLGNGTFISTVPVAVDGGHVFTDLSVGEDTVCAIDDAGVAWCWGSGAYGQLGDGRTTPVGGGTLVIATRPVRVTAPEPFVAVTVARESVCALTRAGIMYCWGDGGARPTQLSGGHRFKMLSAGVGQYCGITIQGEAYCWESIGGAQLSQRVPSTERFTRISAGAQHTCAITADGAAYCWGMNSHAQLGIGQALTFSKIYPPARVAGGLAFRAISAGQSHSCGITLSGGAYCWGTRSYGELGDGLTSYSNEPAPVTTALTIRQIEAGTGSTCAVENTDKVFCWGDNNVGQLGVGITFGVDACPNSACSVQPLEVPSLSGVRSVTVGGQQACALTDNGQVLCWGGNNSGQLGDASISTRSTPVPVITNVRFRALTAGGAHTCGLAVDSLAFCWGSNASGQLGSGGSTQSNVPVAVQGDWKFTALYAGSSHTCGLTAASEVYCWGANDLKQLGVTATDRCTIPDRALGSYSFDCSLRPLRSAGSMSFSFLATGGSHTCGITVDGNAYCWGSNSAAQLGASTGYCNYRFGLTQCSSIPVAVSSGNAFSALSAGDTHTCGLTATGAAYCWGQIGSDYGAVPLGSTPVRLTGPTFDAISSGSKHACGITRDQRAFCWGSNESGQAGPGYAPWSVSPVVVVGGLRF